MASVHLPLDDVPFGDLMAERLGLPVWVDNDVNAAVLAEHRYGAARGTSHAVMLALGTGIGGGLILDGRVYRGATGAAGELGHTVVDDRRPALSLRRPRLPRGARLGHGHRDRGHRGGARAPALGAGEGAWRPTARSAAASSPSWPTPGTSWPPRPSARSAAGWGRAW